jgi:hypothetical protein
LVKEFEDSEVVVTKHISRYYFSRELFDANA